ncbi:putative ABC transport system ATP-binding protein [Streptomyces griseochromogenes]|uniref:ABC transport system ATP-binding protein n=1 Tax=Streptomyces griseochromogenes TaxID=68214 RepID=A0A1B1APC0_9ACTN|nr:ABC transporter ATP-binding protein [Streptomyces griseochromogenes]ANP48360.1 ABC transporter [Streptomyces griseochromogenes]MBP2052990.1 putative ABC transport system ATP-binding protein [Streptomyces griseochromogenes]
MDDTVRLDAVSKVYGKGQGAVAALREVSVSIPRGSFTAVMGPSGSGKSTFLQCAAGLDTPTSGTVRLGGTDLTGMNETKLTRLRRQRVGFVFQAFNLVPSLTAQENITLPLRLAGVRPDRAWLGEIVRRVGLEGRTNRRPAQLSGGQQQRVALARALAARPEVIFGDEPTGALDTMTARDVLALLRETVDDMGQTVVMVTHDPVAASYADTVLFLADGRIVDRMSGPSSDKIAERMTRLGAWK